MSVDLRPPGATVLQPSGGVPLFRGDANFVYEQVVASSTWTVVHNLGKKVSVTVVDASGAVVMAEVSYVGLNAVVITFPYPFSGSAFCN